MIREDGSGPELDLGPAQGKLLLVTMGITRTLEQQSLDMSIWGSADNANWADKPLLEFPQKFYCGTWQVLLDLTGRKDVHHLRAQWKVNRWGHSEQKPLFSVYLFVEDAEGRGVARTA